MNKKGQYAILLFIGSLIIFIFIWAVWLGGFLQTWGAAAIADGTVSGLDAFIIANLNLFIFLGLLLTILIAIYFGKG